MDNESQFSSSSSANNSSSLPSFWGLCLPSNCTNTDIPTIFPEYFVKRILFSFKSTTSNSYQFTLLLLCLYFPMCKVTSATKFLSTIWLLVQLARYPYFAFLLPRLLLGLLLIFCSLTSEARLLWLCGITTRLDKILTKVVKIMRSLFFLVIQIFKPNLKRASFLLC